MKLPASLESPAAFHLPSRNPVSQRRLITAQRGGGSVCAVFIYGGRKSLFYQITLPAAAAPVIKQQIRGSGEAVTYKNSHAPSVKVNISVLCSVSVQMCES